MIEIMTWPGSEGQDNGRDPSSRRVWIFFVGGGVFSVWLIVSWSISEVGLLESKSFGFISRALQETYIDQDTYRQICKYAVLPCMKNNDTLIKEKKGQQGVRFPLPCSEDGEYRTNSGKKPEVQDIITYPIPIILW